MCALFDEYSSFADRKHCPRAVLLLVQSIHEVCEATCLKSTVNHAQSIVPNCCKNHLLISCPAASHLVVQVQSELRDTRDHERVNACTTGTSVQA